jgi:hypothetical protein
MFERGHPSDHGSQNRGYTFDLISDRLPFGALRYSEAARRLLLNHHGCNDPAWKKFDQK